MVDGVESGQAINLVQGDRGRVAGGDGIAARRRRRRVMRSVVGDALRSLIGAHLVVVVAAPAPVVALAIAGRHPVAIGRARPDTGRFVEGLGRLAIASSSRPVVVDQVLLAHSPRTVNVPWTRPVLSKYIRLSVVSVVSIIFSFYDKRRWHPSSPSLSLGWTRSK